MFTSLVVRQTGPSVCVCGRSTLPAVVSSRRTVAAVSLSMFAAARSQKNAGLQKGIVTTRQAPVAAWR